MMRRTLTWKAAVVGGAVLGAGFGSIALAGADDPSTPPGGVELRDVDRQLSSPGAPLSVLPAPSATMDSVSSPVAPAPAPTPAVQSAPSAPSVASAPSPAPAPAPAPVRQAPAPAPAPVGDDSPDSPAVAPAPAPAPAPDDSPASPASVGSIDS